MTTYAYAPDSNRLAAVDDGTGPVSFAYDAAGNTLTDGTRQFAYDARNRMATADGHAYGYNALGQRAFKPRFQTAAPGDADGDGVIDENDLKSLRDMIKSTIPASPGADCNADGAVDNRDVNCIARQIGATKSNGQGKNREPETATFTATAEGDFTQVGWILFAYDAAGHLIGEYDEAGNPIRRYVWLEDLPVAVISTEGIHYLHADHLNTPRAVTGQQGAIVWQADHKPFGEVTESGSFELNLRFPGQYHDRETGLHQNWHREYVPELGRYSQSDPIGLNGGMNPFSYVNANPISNIDPAGLELVCELKGIEYFDRRTAKLTRPAVTEFRRYCYAIPKPTGGIPDPTRPRRPSRFPSPLDIRFDILCERELVVLEQAEWETVVERWMKGYMECEDTCTGEVTTFPFKRSASDPPRF